MNDTNCELTFIPLYIGNGWEIADTYPYTIRNRCFTPTICIDGHGYPCVKLSGRLYYMHRLVGEQFIPNPYNKRSVRHINHIRSDYHLENLRWS